MSEREARKFHRSLGIVVVWFLAGQTVTGLLLSVGAWGVPSPLLQPAGWAHFGWEPLGSIYRLALALATLAQGLSGIYLYYLMRARMKKG